MSYMPRTGAVLQVIPYIETADISTNSSTYADMVSQSITMSAGGILLVDFRCRAIGIGGNEQGRMKLMVDGVDIYEFSGGYTDANQSGIFTALRKITGLAAGARIAKIQWKLSAGGSSFAMSASTKPTQCFATLQLTELAA